MDSVPFGAYLTIFVVASASTAAVTPLVARFSRHLGAVDVPSDPRRVHREPVPTAGGLAMVVGFIVSLAVASQLTAFEELFSLTSQPLGLLLGVLAIAALGLYDDVRELPASSKLAGQLVAALIPALFGIQIVYTWLPGLDVVSVSSDLGLPLTVFAMVAMINAVNLIDGLDGLAAGVVAIAAIGFLVFTVAASGRGLVEDVPSSAAFVAVALTGICIGFLVHNFHPASIFMGDTGSMTLGLLLASAGVSYVGRTTSPASVDFAGTVPLLIPALVLAIPFIDFVFAVVRRIYRRQPIHVADRGHLHHLLIAFGYSHRRAVVVLYIWSATLAGIVLARLWTDEVAWVVLTGLVLVVAGLATALLQVSARALLAERRRGERRKSDQPTPLHDRRAEDRRQDRRGSA